MLCLLRMSFEAEYAKFGRCHRDLASGDGLKKAPNNILNSHPPRGLNARIRRSRDTSCQHEATRKLHFLRFLIRRLSRVASQLGAFLGFPGEIALNIEIIFQDSL